MNTTQLEHWVLSVVDRVTSGRPVEDSRVEAKGDWPEPAKAARRIAGHANAAGGAPVLWVIGLDETARSVVGAQREDLANWWPQVRACFDGVAPDLRDLVVPTGTTAVVGLLFDASRAPFVVKNPVYGTSAGGAVALEVPWRDGTAIRSARREDLVRLLAPLQHLPDVELRSATLSASRQRGATGAEGSINWHLRMELYVTPPTDVTLVLPFHRCRATVSVPGYLEEQDLKVHLEPRISIKWGRPFGAGVERKVHSLTIDSTRDEAVVGGPGFLSASSSFTTTPVDAAPGEIALARLELRPARSTAAVATDAQMPRAKNPQEPVTWEWKATPG